MLTPLNCIHCPVKPGLMRDNRFLPKAAGREGDVGVKHALSAHCARIVNRYLTAAATFGLPLWCVCCVAGVLSALKCPL